MPTETSQPVRVLLAGATIEIWVPSTCALSVETKRLALRKYDTAKAIAASTASTMTTARAIFVERLGGLRLSAAPGCRSPGWRCRRPWRCPGVYSRRATADDDLLSLGVPPRISVRSAPTSPVVTGVGTSRQSGCCTVATVALPSRRSAEFGTESRSDCAVTTVLRADWPSRIRGSVSVSAIAT